MLRQGGHSRLPPRGRYRRVPEAELHTGLVGGACQTLAGFAAEHALRGALQRERVPLGAVFRVMGVLPTFELRSAGRSDGCFWRAYTLSCPGMTAEITETFALDTFERKQQQPLRGQGQGQLRAEEVLVLGVADLPEMAM